MKQLKLTFGVFSFESSMYSEGTKTFKAELVQDKFEDFEAALDWVERTQPNGEYIVLPIYKKREY